jgi:hypothetical protein
MKSVTVQINRGSENDPGEVARGFYKVENDVVMLLDQDGHSTGASQRLGPDDDAHRIAQRLLLKSRPKREGFNRQLRYERSGVA